MADRSWMGVTVYQCPEAKRLLLAEVLSHNLGIEIDGPVEEGEQYSVEEVVLGADDELWAELYEKVGVDDLVIKIVQDPKYEYDGMIHIHVPGLGLYHAAMTASGEPVVTWEQVEPYVGDQEALAKLFGRPWFDAINKAESTEAEQTTEQPKDRPVHHPSPGCCPEAIAVEG